VPRVPPVAVVTDSTSYLPRELVADRGIGEVSLYVRDGAGQRRELDIDDHTRFYDDLRAAPQLPTTSQPSIGDFAAVYEPLVAGGRDVVSVHISGGISGTVETARQAAAEVLRGHPGRRIEVVDSTVSAGALGLEALAAARASAGGDVDAAVAGTEAAIRAMRFWFAVDTLEYLRRGGRIGAAQAWLGGALKIKPILTLDGEITPVERVRTSRRAFERMLEYMRSRRRRRRRVGRPAHPRAGRRRAAHRAGAGDLRLRAGVRLGGRPGHRRARRPGARGLRRHPLVTHRLTRRGVSAAGTGPRCRRSRRRG